MIKINLINFYKIFLIINIYLIIIFLNNYKIPKNSNDFSLSGLFKNASKDLNEIYLKYNNLIYSFSYKYNIIEINFSLIFYDKNNTLIKPSDLTLIYNLHIVCNIKHENNSINVDTLANIFENKYFYCVEYLSINEKMKFGIKIYYGNQTNIIIYLYNSDIIKYQKRYKNNYKFNPQSINKEYLGLINNITDTSQNKSILNNISKLKMLYIDKPYFQNKMNIILNESQWYFKNIYNNYFCFCKGYCLYSKIPELCKYLFYLYIIDNNKNAYNKTEYLLSDFYYYSSDDAYPIFKEMIKNNISAHYMDAKANIFKEICNNQKYCLKVIPIKKTNIIDSEYLEKYLDIILKLKAVIVGHELKSNFNIFYNIDYISYINLGHGIKYFKHFLYNNYSSYKKYNKIVLPPSHKIISLAKKYGWTDDNIIKNCLPKWDKYEKYKEKIIFSSDYNNKNKSIFIMFTWRNLVNNSVKISSLYLNNIIDLINNNNLKKNLIKNNIILYFTFHPNFEKYKNTIYFHELVKYIGINNISDCLMKSNLLISDFSSIIFDMIYQRKPFLIFIPDIFDPNIKDIYEQGYYEIINDFKNGRIDFKNTFFSIKETVKKIIYYIENGFKIESNLEKFYNSFELNCKNNTKNFINYLLNDL